jgi:hypothetical protein
MSSYHPEDPPALGFAARIGDELHPIFVRSSVVILGVDEKAFKQEGAMTRVTGDRVMSPRGT